MKIGIVVLGGVDRSGNERVIPCLLGLLKRLAAAHEVHVFALEQEPRPSRYRLCGASVHNIGRAPRRLRAIGAMLAEHRRRRFAVLHAFWATPAGVVAVAMGSVFRVPVLVHLGGGELVAIPEIAYGDARSRRGRLLVDIVLHRAARVTAASTGMRRLAAARGRRVEHLTLGVDLEEWPTAPIRLRELDAPARLLHVASLNRVKDQLTLLKAAARLRDRGVAYHLDVVGEDTLNGEIQRAADALGLEGFVTFHGFLRHRELRPLVEGAHLLLMSSCHEAGPVVVLEAAVVGLPTIGTDVGYVHDWAPEAAVATPVGDHEALAGEVEGLLADEPRRRRLAGAAQARALREDADYTASEVLRHYRELTGTD